MENGLILRMHSFTIDCRAPHALAEFYAALLQWEVKSLGQDWACVCAPATQQGSYPSILFQRNPDYKPPVWPAQPGEQQQMAHIDFEVNDLEKAVQHAIQCGATVADVQFSEEWKVMFDPEGHPFCLCRLAGD